jgi:hypothetical protein
MFSIRSGDVLHSSTHVLEATHEGLLLDTIVIKGAAIRFGLQDGVCEHEGSQHQSFHAISLAQSLEKR